MQRVLEAELHQVHQKIVDAHISFRDVTEEVQRISALVAVGQTDTVTVDPIPADIYKTLRYTDVNLLTTSNARIPVRSHGEGTQSLSVLLLFNAYLKTRLQADVDLHAEPIIAIEEPEAHLHPNAARAVWQLISDLPGQKIVATHSGDMLSEVPLSKIRRMNRIGEGNHCQYIPDNLLTDEELRKLNHHIRRNRGELLFARCWLLVEGETDVSVFAECADLIGINLHNQGVRLVEYSQAGGPAIFIKVADALGVKWHLVTDNDHGGQRYVKAVRSLLNGRNEPDHISALTYSNMDVLLCCSGYGHPYRDGIGLQKEAELEGLDPDSQEYWKKVYKIVNQSRGFSKPAAALRSILTMKSHGSEGVPDELRDILKKTMALAAETP